MSLHTYIFIYLFHLALPTANAIVMFLFSQVMCSNMWAGSISLVPLLEYHIPSSSWDRGLCWYAHSSPDLSLAIHSNFGFLFLVFIMCRRMFRGT